MPKTMKAAVLNGHGATFRMEMIARPEPSAGQALVRIKASAANPLDLKIFDGSAAHARHPLPAVLGIDLAGVVEAVGSGVHHVKTGDEVFGMTGGVGGHQGSLAEFSAVDANLLARKPKNFTMREAAALPLTFITAWEGLVDRAQVRSGQRVLIHGGAGGVGHIAVQLSRALGTTVFATGSAKDRPYIESLGAGFIARNVAVADYVSQHTHGAGFDIVYDTVGGPVLDASFNAVKRFGHVVSALGWGTHSLAPLSFRAATYSGVFTLLPLLTGEGRDHHGEILRQAAELGEEGKIMPRLDPRAFGMHEIDQAHLALRNRDGSGKIVIDIPGHGAA